MSYALLVLLLSGLWSHDVQVSFYKISQQSEGLVVDISLEQQHVTAAFEQLSIPYHEETVQQYIEEHFTLAVNEEEHTIIYSEIEMNEKHISVKGMIPTAKGAVQSLDIHNTCLLTIEDHSNIIEVLLHDKQRDFLMNIHRTAIRVSY